MDTLHRWVGLSIVLALLVIALWGLTLNVLRRPEAPTPFWGLQHYTENILVLQIGVGIVLLLMGRRIPTSDLRWLHYVYGSVFPLIALVGGRLAGMRREERDYVGVAWGAFFGFGLTARALMTGCGTLVSAIPSCLGF